jgi:hypothetical protein
MDDIPKIGITGMPSVGKTQTLIKIIEKIQKSGYKLEGMITTPIIEKKKRVGFYIEDWQTKEKEVFARLDLDSKDKVGKYGVDLGALERVGVHAMKISISSSLMKSGKWRCSQRNSVKSLSKLLILINRLWLRFIKNHEHRCYRTFVDEMTSVSWKSLQ